MFRIATILIFVSVSLALGKDDDLKEGTYYTYDQVGIRGKKEKSGKLKVEFLPTDEKFYWCPGIRIKKTDKVTIVTFVRSKTSQTGRIDQKAKVGKRLTRTVSISTNGKDIYVRNSENNYRRIYKSPDSKLPDDITISNDSTKKASKGKKEQSKKASAKTKTLPLMLRPKRNFLVY